ncbi:MAG: AraC family transcriptional regulator [Gammaproteobacteria bacterium]|nr:AraC family transcriptional regulator [Gammaproteobacteria bacterium]
MFMNTSVCKCLLTLGIFMLSASVKAAEPSKAEKQAQNTLKSISSELQSLKQDVVSLNNDLRLMEEKILFPSSTKYSVFLSLRTGKFLKLESVKLKLDGKFVSTHLYSNKQREALARGGIQKLHVTNLNEGKHSITAFFTGLDINGRPVKLAETVDFEKGPAGEYLEIAVVDNPATQEPMFKMKRWQ